MAFLKSDYYILSTLSQGLNRKKLLSREVIVRLANPKTDPVTGSVRPIPAALKAGGERVVTEEQKAARIRALEAKLAGMEGGGEEFRVSTIQPSSSNKSGSKPYSRNKP